MSHLSDTTRVYLPGLEGDTGYEAVCTWSALCDRPADGVGDAGLRGNLPMCRRCAEQVGIAELTARGSD